jgi:uncharacterized protein
MSARIAAAYWQGNCRPLSYGCLTLFILGHMELMMRLPDLVGSPLSINPLREDLQVSRKAVSAWLALLKRLYRVFLLSPFGASRIRAVKKE